MYENIFDICNITKMKIHCIGNNSIQYNNVLIIKLHNAACHNILSYIGQNNKQFCDVILSPVIQIYYRENLIYRTLHVNFNESKNIISHYTF